MPLDKNNGVLGTVSLVAAVATAGVIAKRRRGGSSARAPSQQKRLTKSGWTARWDGARKPITSIYLDYEGLEFKRSQSIIRYSTGQYGYDWPEIVPASVKAKVEALLEDLHRGSLERGRQRGSSSRDGIVERVGDVDPLTYGGGVVFAEGDGGYLLEYTYGAEDDEDYDEDDESHEHTVYQVDLGKNVADFVAYNDWADLDDVAASAGSSKEEMLSNAKTVSGRARLAQDIAGHYGWDNFDNYPVEFTSRELVARWGLG